MRRYKKVSLRVLLKQAVRLDFRGTVSHSETVQKIALLKKGMLSHPFLDFCLVAG